MQVLILKEYKRRGGFSPARTFREQKLWDLIYDNIIASYEHELN